MSAPAREPAAAQPWTRAAERGSLPLIRLAAGMSVALGRPLTRALLPLGAAYFLAFGGRSRGALRGYWRRCLGRDPTPAQLYRSYFAFASTLHDRIFFLRGRFDLFDTSVCGRECLPPGGAVLLGAHLGSFEALRACGRVLGGRRVVMAMYRANAQRINGVLESLSPQAMQDVVALGELDAMLRLEERLAQGALVGFLADRTLGGEATVEVAFLGEPARFPTGPMRMAAALRRPVLFMAGLYRGGNRYEVRFEPLADFSTLDGVPRAERERRVREAVAAYAARVERCCREAPDNWFNFHDFWGDGA